jgi:non-specific serine/threonine protein kinase
MGAHSAAIEGDAEQPIPEVVREPAFHSVQEAAAMLSVSESTVRRAIARGALPAVKQRQTLQIAPDALARYRAKRGSSQRAGPASMATHVAVPGLPALVSLPRQTPTRHGVLPVPLTRLIGRKTDLAAVADLLAEGRLVTLVGPGGVGKTRLVLHAAGEISATFADGVAFVDLAPVRDPAHVLAAVAEAVGVQNLGVHPLRDTLISALGERNLLLVLDNCEHVLPAAPLIADLLRHCPRLHILTSSRTPLGLTGERLWPVAPLPLPPEGHPGPAYGPAVELFVDRAQAAAPEFRLSAANAEVVAQICRHLDGLPLAIELAAAWMRIMSPALLRQRLAQRLPLLRGGARDQPLRFQTMRQAIAWSYDLLSPQEARLMLRLGVFVGGFTLEAVEAVAPDDVPDALATLRELVGNSLVTRATADDGSVRFGMLETIREDALERLAESGDARPALDAHAAYYLGFAERHAPDQFRDDDVVQRVAAIATEHANLLAALEHFAAIESGDASVRLAALLGQFWYSRSLHRVGRACLERALARSAASPALEAIALANLGQLMSLQGDFAAADTTLARAEERAAEANDPLPLAIVRCRQAVLSVVQGDSATGQARAAEAESLARQGGDPLLAALACFSRARAFHYAGELDRAESLYRQILADPPPPRYAAAVYRLSLAMIARTRGQHMEALALYAAAIGTFRDIGEQWSVANSLEGIADALVSLGRAEAAARLFGAAANLRALIGVPMIPEDIAAYERAAAAARAAIGPAAFAAAWAAGGALTADAAVAEAQAADALVLAAGESNAGSSPPLFGLSPRQLQVLRHLVAGHSDRQIAEALFISRRTASHHVAAIMTKLGAHTRGDAAVRAVRDGLI